MSQTATAQVVEHEIGSNGELVLKLIEGEVRIRAIDGPVARVRIDAPGLEERIGIDRLPGALHVRVPEQFMSVGWLGFDLRGLVSPRHNVELEVEVPRTATVSIDGASTRVRADGLVGEQRIHLVSGDVRLERGGGLIRVDGVSGRVSVDAAAPIAVVVRTVSGDVTVSAPSITELRVNSMSSTVNAAGAFVGSGPFRIESVSGRCVIATDTPLRVESRSMTGTVSSERSDDQARNVDGRTITFGRGGPILSFNSLSGSLRVRPLGPAPSGAQPSRDATGTAQAGRPDSSGTAMWGSAPAADGPVAGAEATDGHIAGTPAAPAGGTAPAAPVDASASAWDASQLAGQHPEQRPAWGTSPAVPTHAPVSDPHDRRLAILRALERGEISVDEAGRELEQLDERG